MDPAELRPHLEAFIARETGAAVRVENLRKLPGGASREIWSFDADIGGDTELSPLQSIRQPL